MHLLIAIFLGFLVSAYSTRDSVAQEECTSCDEVYSLEETIDKAELIILAESEPFNSVRPGGPEKITANVLKVLKGTYTDKTIELKSWTGTCPYGFVFTSKQELLFIVKDLAGNYTRYKDGCGAENMKYENGMLDGKISLEDFAKQHNLTIQ